MLTSTLPPPGKKIRAEGKSLLWAGLVRGAVARNPSKPRIAWMVDETGKPDMAALVSAYAPMVKRLALRLVSRLPPNVELDDLIQCGMMGLIEAIERYRDDDRAEFETYALARIRGAMIDALRETDWVPRQVRKEMRRVEEAIAALEQSLGRHPTEGEVAEALGLDLEAYQRLLSQAKGHQILYFDDLMREPEDGEDFLERHLGDDEPGPQDLTESAELRAQLVRTIESLPEKEKLVLSLYYEHELNFKEIGAVLGVSESRVSQLHTQAILRMRARLLGGEEGHLPRGRRGRPPKNAPTCGEAPAGETGR